MKKEYIKEYIMFMFVFIVLVTAISTGPMVDGDEPLLIFIRFIEYAKNLLMITL